MGPFSSKFFLSSSMSPIKCLIPWIRVCLNLDCWPWSGFLVVSPIWTSSVHFFSNAFWASPSSLFIFWVWWVSRRLYISVTGLNWRSISLLFILISSNALIMLSRVSMSCAGFWSLSLSCLISSVRLPRDNLAFLCNSFENASFHCLIFEIRPCLRWSVVRFKVPIWCADLIWFT